MKFKLGDTVYYAKCNYEHIKKTCPICFGKLKVTLILGNDDLVVLPCNYCAPDYDPPCGFVEEYDYVVAAQMVTIDRVTTEVSGKGEQGTYCFNGCYGADESLLFLTKEEALSKAQEIKAQLDQDQATRAEYIKKDKQKSFSWNALYHIREAKRGRKQAEYHDSMAVLCKARAKGE